MRSLAMILSAVAFGASLIVTLAYAFILRWERTAYGRQVFVGMFVMTLVFGGFRYQYSPYPGKDAVVAVLMALAIPVIAWRLATIIRKPHGGTNGDLPDRPG